MKKKVLGIVLATVLALSLGLVFAGPVGAATYQIRVSQEQHQGVGDFVELGIIDIFDQSGSSAAEVYNYAPKPATGPDFCPVSYRGTVVDAMVDTAQMFFVNTSDGLALFVVYDDKNDDQGDCSSCALSGDTTDGWAQMRFDLDSTTPDYLVKDDGQDGSPSNDFYNIVDPGVDGYAKNLVARHEWNAPRTDGVVIGPLECPWTVDVRFMRDPPIGIDAWKVVGPDHAVIDLTVELARMVRLECIEASEIEIPVDIKPQSCPNPLNVKSKGVLPVAILGTEDFDVTEIDPTTVKLEGVSPLRWAIEDVATPYDGELSDCYSCTTAGPDGYDDLTLKFSTQEIVEAIGEVDDGACVMLTVTGELYDETVISGSDYVIIKKKGKK